jgi:hypothetical protein
VVAWIPRDRTAAARPVTEGAGAAALAGGADRSRPTARREHRGTLSGGRRNRELADLPGELVGDETGAWRPSARELLALGLGTTFSRSFNQAAHVETFD